MTQYLRCKVAEFHTAFGVTRLHTLHPLERLAMTALRAELINEEGRELRAAHGQYTREPNLVNLRALAKEMADLLYVTVGTALILATPIVDPIATGDITANRAEGNVQQEASRVVASLELLGHQIHNGWDERNLFTEIDGIGSELQDVANAVVAMAMTYHVPLLAVFDAVHTSNMTKLNPETGQPVLRSDGKVLKGTNFRPADLSFLESIAA